MKILFVILTLVLPFCLIVGCHEKEKMAELEVFKTQAENERQNEAIFRQFTDELNRGNIEVFDELFTPDYTYYFPSNTQEPISLEETKKMIKTHLISFPDYKWTIEELFAVKDRIIARITTTSTFAGDYYGIPATGDKVESSAIFIIRMKNGKIVEQRREGDVLSVMEQLGMELKPRED